MAKRERECEELDGVSKVLHPSPNAKIHSVVTSVSPMKKAKTCSFFDGEISDGKATMRVFGFDSGVRRRLADFGDSKSPVALSNCEVKSSRKGQELKILVTKRTEMLKSDKVFDVAECSAKKDGNVIVLSELTDLYPFQRVTVEAKVVRLEDIGAVPGGKKKRDVVISDSSGSARFTVWESEIDKVEAYKRYRLSGMVVREFRGRKFLSTSTENSIIHLIADIGYVEEESVEENTTTDLGQPTLLCVRDARVVGVMHLDWYNGCLTCKTKLIPNAEDTDQGQCPKCNMLQSLDACRQEVTTQLMIKGAGENLTLRACRGHCTEGR